MADGARRGRRRGRRAGRVLRRPARRAGARRHRRPARRTPSSVGTDVDSAAADFMPRTVVRVALRPLDRCRRAPSRSPGTPARPRRSSWAPRWPCSSIPSSTTRCWSCGWPRTATEICCGSGADVDRIAIPHRRRTRCRDRPAAHAGRRLPGPGGASSGSAVTELVGQRVVDPRLPKPVAERPVKRLGQHPLVGLGQFAHALRTQQQPRSERRHRQQRRPVQGRRQRGGVSALRTGFGADRVDRPGQSRCRTARGNRCRSGRRCRSRTATAGRCPAGRPARRRTAAAATAGCRRGRPARCRCAPAPPAVRRRRPARSRPPSRRPRRPESPSPRPLSSSSMLVAAVGSVEADRRGGDEHRRPVRSRGGSDSASRRVGSMRLSRMAALCASVNRPAIDAPARCTTASTPSSRSAAAGRDPTAVRPARLPDGGPAGSPDARRWSGTRTTPSRPGPTRR